MARKLNQLGGFGFGSNPAARKAVRKLRPRKPQKPVTYTPSTPTQVSRPVNPPSQPIPGTTDWLAQFTHSYGSAPQGVGQKQRQQYYSTPVYPGAGMTNQQLDALVKSAAQTQFGPAQTELNQQYGQSAAMEQKIPEWFAGYQAMLKDLSAQDQAASQAAYSQITGLGGTLANAAAQAATQDQSQMQADAAIRGATVDPAAVTRATQAAALNTQALSDQAALQTQLGYNTGANWRTQQQAGGQAQIQALQGELGYRRGTLDPQALQLTRDLGAFANTYRNDQRNTLVDQAQNQQAIDWATQKDKIGLANDAAENAAAAASSDVDFASKHGVTRAQYAAMTPQQRAANDRRFKRQSTPGKAKEPEKINQYGYTDSDWRSMTTAQRQKAIKEYKQNTALPGDKPDSGLTPSQANDAWSTVSTIADYYMHPPKVDKAIGMALGLDPSQAGRPLTSDEVTQLVRMGKSPIGQPPSPEIINVARSLASTGGRGIGPWGVSNAHRAGLQNVRKRYKVLPAPKRKKPKFPTIANGGLGS